MAPFVPGWPQHRGISQPCRRHPRAPGDRSIDAGASPEPRPFPSLIAPVPEPRSPRHDFRALNPCVEAVPMAAVGEVAIVRGGWGGCPLRGHRANGLRLEPRLRGSRSLTGPLPLPRGWSESLSLGGRLRRACGAEGGACGEGSAPDHARIMRWGRDHREEEGRRGVAENGSRATSTTARSEDHEHW